MPRGRSPFCIATMAEMAAARFNYVTSPPSENSQHLTDFQSTLEPARDFGLERRGIAAVYAPRVDNRGGALIVARGG